MRNPIFESLDPRCYMAGNILFVGGADRSGGFIEATNDFQRTEQLADITNASTANANHGWKQLADQLRSQGHTLTQVKEPLALNDPSTGQTNGAPIDFAAMNLSQYDAIVMASNNAVYPKASIDAIENYIRNGGGVLFISDGNFGSNWADSPNSDTQFLARFGLKTNQDNGTYSLKRSAGDFAAAAHPVLFGVNEIDGEGVSPIVVPATPPSGVTITRVIGARDVTFNNNPASSANLSRGTSRGVNASDASLVLTNAGAGRLAAYFDRNTFFNSNGAGTNITRFNNSQFATNLFNWVSDKQPPAVASSSFTQGNPYVLKFRLDDNLNGTFTRSDVRLRNRKTGANLPGSLWSMSLNEGNGFTDVTITIKSAAPTGPYQLRVERRMFADDSGNVRSGAIRYAFTLLSGNEPSRMNRATSNDVKVESLVRSIFSDSLMIIP